MEPLDSWVWAAEHDKNVYIMPQKQLSMKWLSLHIQKFFILLCAHCNIKLWNYESFNPPIKPRFVEIVQIDEKTPEEIDS